MASTNVANVANANGHPPAATDPIVPATPTLFNVNTSNIIKLDSTKYLVWSRQMHALLDGYELAGYLDGSVVSPSATIVTGTTVADNPEFKFWKRQDKLLYSALIGAILAPIQPLVSRASSSSEIWDKLANTFAQPSRGHIKQLKTQLQQWVKGNKSVDEYIQGVTTRMDQLAILGKPLDHEDQVEVILAGLPEEYKTVVDQIEGKDTPPTIPDVHERLRNHEAKLLYAAAMTSTVAPITANAVQQRNNTNNYRNKSKNGNNNNWQPSSQSNWQQSNRQDSRGPKPYLGKCQICGVHGHSAKRCSQL